MTSVSLISEWNVSLTTQEFRLVMKSLGGRLKPEEIKDAKNLGDRLTRMRGQALQKGLKDAERLLAVVDESESTQ